MEVRLDFDTFKTTHEKLEQSYESLAAVKASIQGYSSKSEAMAAFKKRVKQFEKVVDQYAELLGEDSLSFYEAGSMFVDMDSKEAAKYRDGLYDTRNMCAPD